MTAQETRELFEKRRALFRSLDAVALALDHSEDGVVESPLGGTLHGREEIEAIYRSWFNAFPDMEMRFEDLMIEGNKVALFWSMRGSHVGDFCGLSSTGKLFEVQGVSLHTIESGEITHERRIYDFTGLLLQLGVLKAKPGF